MRARMTNDECGMTNDVIGTLAGPLHRPGLDAWGLAEELRLAVSRWQPIPPCDGCGAQLRFEGCFVRLDRGGYGRAVAHLCESCLDQHFARLRLAMFEHRHTAGMRALNDAFTLCVAAERRAA